MTETRFGIMPFQEIDLSTTPEQPNEQPYADDPFCGNENNRRAHERRMALKKAAEGGEQKAQKPAQTGSNERRGAAAPAWKANA
jgi:hypothetical protein